ncbi:MAG: DUF3306 domain-containing protein [Rhizobiaceae bacterium]|nr:DUF3306 domain-containing protein [Rhizobiaceae bacterium]MCV0407962.1 DUF3306 domain-containing protein [Rhizobiaceae bacterium]
MSGGADNPFARWSRRKLAALSDKSRARPEAEQTGEEAAGHIDTDTSPLPPDPVQPEAGEAETDGPAEPLPRLEDLTAESDLTAFLKKGVPLALKSAALRKMWSLDPRIRDYVGPSEYAWDFNRPGSMAGFGPLDAKKTVVGFLSKTAGAMEPDAEPIAADRPCDASERPATAPSDTASEAGTRKPSPVAEQLEPNPAIDVPDAAHDSSGDTEPASHLHSPDATKRSQVSELVVRPRHGGAMPR